MMTLKSVKYQRRWDITLRIGEIQVNGERCSVPGCKCTDLYDIQAEKPENNSVAGGIFCKDHANAIFNCFPASKFLEEYQEILLSRVPEEQKKLDEWAKKHSIYGDSD